MIGLLLISTFVITTWVLIMTGKSISNIHLFLTIKFILIAIVFFLVLLGVISLSFLVSYLVIVDSLLYFFIVELKQ